MKPGVFSQSKSAGVYHLTHTQDADIPKLAADAKREYRLVDLSPCQTKDQALIRLGHDLAFPDWYGANFDALNDCLNDNHWRPEKGLIVKITGLDRLNKADADTCGTLLEILDAACHPDHPQNLPPLWFLIDTPLTGIKPLPKA
jgi:RNAse (barnase) inhibitor barstar